jgi:hypothetical protein
MSWDAVILRIRSPLRPAEVVAESEYLPLGSPESVAAAIQSAFPPAKWDDPMHAHCRLDEYTAILFNLEGVESSNCVLVSVSGNRDPIPSLLELANANNWIILDVQNADFIDPADPSCEGWLGYRSVVEGIGRNETHEG